ncbi:MAG TPA: cytochrome c1 [Burkholderiales bacterium]|nr:cytochrome c1 [Burkholderiales bacterium]
MRTLIASWVLAAFALAIGGAALASEGDIRFEPAPVNRLNDESLQRGARVFVNYCLNCHSAKYMRYNRLTDIGLTEAQIRDNLMFATDKIGDTMDVAMPAKDAKQWFGTTPPDLSVEARVRGTEWLYNYFLGFYKDPSTPSGWNNLVFPNVAMPHVFWELQGTNRLEVKEYEDQEQAKAAAIAAKQLALTEPAPNHKYEVKTVVVDTPGSMTPEQYRAMVADLVNYLDYMAEPAKNKRINTGIVVLLYLGVLFFLVCWAKREYWKDIH